MKDELKWILCDLDNTICNNSGFPDFIPTQVITGTKKALREITDRGYKVIIFTARPYSDYQLIEQFLDDNDLEYRRIICGKPLAKYMIDDKAIEFKGDWDKVLNKIK
jgi:hydroxymethylpyrimidine pyrophosphatase-like HAD family hydrolase